LPILRETRLLKGQAVIQRGVHLSAYSARGIDYPRPTKRCDPGNVSLPVWADRTQADDVNQRSVACHKGQFVGQREGPEMAIKKPKPEEIVVNLRQAEVLTGQGMPRLDAIRQISVTEQTYYRWKKKYGGMGAEQLKELKRLQKENQRLRRAVSDLTLDKRILKEAASGNF